MNKIELGSILEKAISLYEEDNIILEERIIRLEEVIRIGRDYNTKYKNPHKHYFMGKPIKYSDILLDELEKILIK